MDWNQLLPLPSGDATAVDLAAGRLRTLAGNLSRLGEAFRAEGTGMARAWQSPEASQLATSSATRLAGSTGEHAGRFNTAAQALEAYAVALREAQLAVRRLHTAATQAEYEARQAANRPPDLTAEQRSEIYRAHLDTALAALQRQHQAVTAELDRAAAACAQALTGAIPGYQPGMSPGTAASTARASAEQNLTLTHAEALVRLGGRGADGLRPPAAAADPGQNAAWWRTLSDDERNRIIAASHRELGNLDGIPAAARSQANERTLAEDLNSTNETLRRNAQSVRSGLDRARQQTDAVTGRPVTAQLLVYDPLRFNGDGRAAISVGDVNSARNVAVSVPGITNTVTSLPGNVDAAYNLYDEARRADPRQGTAVIAWMGYNAPSGYLGLPTETPAEGDAREGARYLAADVNGIRASRGDDQPHLTVIGHSYGSVTTGISASREGLPADDVVLLGSPGTTVPHASDLKVGQDHVWIGAASQDPVSQTGWFNTDPAMSSYGGARFRAENEGGFPIDTQNPIYDHVHYFDRQSESLYNMSQVVTGRYDQVQVTPGRISAAGLVIDPEAFRTVGHPTNR
jgi:hypothetical protein